MTQPLLVLMYHRVLDPKRNIPTDSFIKHLEFLVKNCQVVTPGMALSSKKLNVCLTFDDAYYDFYHVVYPLLQQWKIQSILAVSAQFIVDSTKLSWRERVQIPYPEGMDLITSKEKVPFCTWQELKEMAHSQWVQIASHGFAHGNLQKKETNWIEEIVHSKNLLQSKLQVPIQSFVYPFGKFTRKVHRFVTQHYQLAFRIGGATNRNFAPINGLIYRVDADSFWQQNVDLLDSLPKFKRKYWFNKLRFK